MSKKISRLEELVLGAIERTHPQFHEAIGRTKIVSRLFEADGIAFIVETDRFGSGPRTVVPGASTICIR
jgi:hypothetical protein